ncbi:MAG: hydroxyacid dehydrogenase, partial [Anaerolineales bacterium]|nr:hydroxyacid dehydrogenase [Anaerolineales bacterium]
MPDQTVRDSRRPRVLVCDAIADIGVQMLSNHAEVDIKTELSPDELLDTVPNYDAVVVRSATQVTAELITHGLNLKVIGRAGAGLDNIDVVAAQENDIIVVNSPDANSVAVAEHTMGLLLSLARRLPHATLSMKAGRWDKKLLIGTGLQGKTLGIVGFGRIGREVAIRAQAFGMKILVNQKPLTPETLLENVTSVDLVDLLQQSDFVTLHVPLKPETHSMIGAAQLGMMKPTAYLINTARGGVVDEDALLTALNEGQIAGVALDVFEKEPHINHVLVQHERVIATP